MHAVGAEPDAGGDLVTAGGGAGEGLSLTGLGRRRRRQAGVQPELDVQFGELAVQVLAHLRPEGGQKIVGHGAGKPVLRRKLDGVHLQRPTGLPAALPPRRAAPATIATNATGTTTATARRETPRRPHRRRIT